ncbi:helix-turn-helix transcriptional regulator [bacterium]|nr:helix-turn-helix transcriptional regulator [bacterium]
MDKGLTQEALAEKVNIHPTYVGKIESGKFNH